MKKIFAILSLLCAVVIGHHLTACKQQNNPATHQVLAQSLLNGTTPNCSVNQQVGFWYIDPSNLTGCASDANTGTSDVCGPGGQGPLLHFRQYTFLVCGNNPTVNQNVTILFMSSMTDNTDKIVYKPVINNGATVTIAPDTANAAVVTSLIKCFGTLGTVTAKNRATPQLLKAIFPVCTDSGFGATAQGMVVQNTTHPSYATIYTNVTGTTWNITQPLNITGPTTIPPPEVDTWATSDVFATFQTPKIFVAELSPIVSADDAGNNNTGLFVTLLNLADYSGTSGTNVTQLGGNGFMQFVSDKIDTAIQITNTGNQNGTFPPMGFYNTDIVGGTFGGGNSTSLGAFSPATAGGYISGITFQTGISLDGDIIVGNSLVSALAESGNLGLVYVDTGVTLTLSNGQFTSTSGYNSAKGIVWGPGTVNVTAAKSKFPAGVDAGGNYFNGVTLKLDGQAKACLSIPSVDAGYTGVTPCNRDLSPAKLDTDLSATSGCYTNGPSSICNY